MLKTWRGIPQNGVSPSELGPGRPRRAIGTNQPSFLNSQNVRAETVDDVFMGRSTCDVLGEHGEGP